MSFFENNLRFQIICPIAIIMLAIVILLTITTPKLVRNNIEKRVTYSSVSTLKQMKLLRAYYTDNVVKKVQKTKALAVGLDHDKFDNTIPLPATMIHDLSELFNQNGSTLRIYSNYPFPNRMDRKLDKFQQSAWQTLQAEPEAIIKKVEQVKNRSILRVAISDRMQVQACVDCHNAHPLTPKNDWQLDEVRGVLEISTDISSQLALAKTISMRIIAVIILASITLIILFFVLTRRITKQVSSISQDMIRLGNGDYETEIEHQVGTLEVKQMHEAFVKFKHSLLTSQQLEKRQQLIETEKIQSLARMLASVAHDVNTPLSVSMTATSYARDQLEGLEQKIASEELSKSELVSSVGACHQSLDIISSNLANAVSLIQSFKQVSVDQISEESREIILSDYVQDVVNSLHPRIKKAAVEVIVECKKDCHFFTYPGLLSQVLTNLITNSIIHGFNNNKGGKISIVLSGDSQGLITIHYCDDGVGIPNEILNKVMEPFFTTKRAEGGSGLGLSIIHSIVTQKLKGSIVLTSEENEGLVVDISFPAKLAKKNEG